MNKKIKILALCGKAGSGKDYILNKFLKCYSEEEYWRVVPTTTRPRRTGEEDGKDYWFIDDKTFIEDLQIGYYIGHQVFRGWHYGYNVSAFRRDKINIGIFPPRTIKDLKLQEEYEVIAVEVFTEDRIRLIRQLERDINVDIKEVLRRYTADDKDFEDFNADEIFNNGNFKNSLEFLDQIGQKLVKDR